MSYRDLTEETARIERLVEEFWHAARIDLRIEWDHGRHEWRVLDNRSHAPAIYFGTVEEVQTWAYWFYEKEGQL